MCFSGGPISVGREGALKESVLIRKAQGGDAEAFKRLVEMHASVIWAVANRMASNSTVAEDLFQETVIRFWRGLPSFQGGSKLSTWLYRIAYRVCLDGLQSEGKHGMDSLEERSEAGVADPADEQSDGQKIESKVEAKDAIMRAMSSLDPEWKLILTLYYWKGLSLEEIAEVTGRPSNTVKVYLHRARASMRKSLEDGGYPPEV